VLFRSYQTNTFIPYGNIMDPTGVYHRFFNDPKIQEILHVRGYNLPGINFVPEKSDSAQKSAAHNYFIPQHWVVCNNRINDDMNYDRPASNVPALQHLAKHIRVLLYSGEFDLNCNTLGTLHTLEANTWLGRQWSEAKRGLWKFNGDVSGEYFSIGDNEEFAFLIVRKSGHMLPMDVPGQALDMLLRFTQGQSLFDVQLPSEITYMVDLVEDSPRLKGSASGFSETVPPGRSLRFFFPTAIVLVLLSAGLLLSVVYVSLRKNAYRSIRSRSKFGFVQLSPATATPPRVSLRSEVQNVIRKSSELDCVI